MTSSFHFISFLGVVKTRILRKANSSTEQAKNPNGDETRENIPGLDVGGKFCDNYSRVNHLRPISRNARINPSSS